MPRHILMMVGAAMLFAGSAQAETPAAPAYMEDPGYLNGGHFWGQTLEARNAQADKHAEAAAPAAAATVAARSTESLKEGVQEQRSSADPGYLNGGHGL